MLNHGISTGALFMLAGMLYERKHTYDFTEYGGLATPMPVYATFFLVIVLSSVGLPLMNGFVGEFLVLSGAFQDKAIYGILGASGVIWGAWYLLWMYQRVFYGPISHDENRTVPDIDRREQFALWPLAVMALIMGVASPYWMRSIDPSVAATIPKASTGERAASPGPSPPVTPSGMNEANEPRNGSLLNTSVFARTQGFERLEVRHPDGRKASERFLQHASPGSPSGPVLHAGGGSRPEGPCVPQHLDSIDQKRKVPRSYSDADENASSLTELGMTVSIGQLQFSRTHFTPGAKPQSTIAGSLQSIPAIFGNPGNFANLSAAAGKDKQ
jgi:hypothetical protein